MTTLAPAPSAVAEYAEDVVAGRAPACKWVRLAAERHLRDLGRVGSPDFPYYFDEETATWASDFFPKMLKHSKGEWAGKPLVLEPWQMFIIGSLFGWKRLEDDMRRFRVAYVEVPRKNGKSTIVAGLGLLLAFFDDEPGAEVYAAATKREQAKIVWGEAYRMVLASPNIRRRVRALKANLHDPLSASKFEPLGADVDGMDGLNISGAIVDELHAHRTRRMWDVIETATGSRRQPLTVTVTTAGYDRQSVCWEQHDYGAKVLDRVIDDETVFVYIATIDEGDDWADPEVWAKANPNLGVSVKLDDLERKCEKAKQVPGEQNAFLRLHLDIWTQQDTRWLDVDLWDENAGAVDTEALRGRECWAGLDLSSVLDITALELWFPEEGGGGKALSYFWVPGENMLERERKDRVPYSLWQRQGFLAATEGNVVDYEAIRLKVSELGAMFDIQEIAIDRWNSTQLQTQLRGDGFEVVEFGQGFAAMTAPTKELQKLLLERKVQHGGNPVLRWMAANVAVEQDPAGNLKPSKAKSTERIDGIVALIMAIGQAMTSPDQPSEVFFA